MSIAFIVVEAFVAKVLNRIYSQDKLTLNEIFAHMEDEITLPSYRKTVELLKNVSLKP